MTVVKAPFSREIDGFQYVLRENDTGREVGREVFWYKLSRYL